MNKTRLNELRGQLKTAFEEAGEDMDMSRVKSLTGTDAEKVAQIKAINDEPGSMQAALDALKEGEGQCGGYPLPEGTVFSGGTQAKTRGWKSGIGTLRPPTRQTVEEAMQRWLEGAREGLIRNRSSDPYKPSAIRGYERNYRLRVREKLGHLQLTDVRRTDLQDFIDAMQAEGLAASTIDCTINPLRAIYRRALSRGEVGENPVRGVELPKGGDRRDRIASPDEASRLLAALPAADRPIWATALYAGLRRGELKALAADSIDLATGLIHVER